MTRTISTHERSIAENTFADERSHYQQQIAHEKSFSAITSAILADDNTEAIFEKLASIVGRTLNVDRSLIFRVDLAEARIENLCGWLNPDMSYLAPITEGFNLKEFRNVNDFFLEQHDWIESHHDNINGWLAKDKADKIVHGQLKIKSLLWLPFSFNPEGYYVLIVNQVTHVRQWEKHEIEFLVATTAQVELALQKRSLLIDWRTAESKATESEERYQLLVQNSSEGIFLTDPSTRSIIEANQKFLSMTGYSESEISGLKLSRFALQSQSEIDHTVKKLTRENHVQFVGKYRRKDGSVFDAEASVSVVKLRDQTVYLTNVRDITQRIKDETYIKESFQLTKRTLSETVNALMLMSEKRDPYTAGHKIRVTRVAYRIGQELGLNERQLYGLYTAATLHDIGKIYVPSDILNKPGRLNSIEMDIIQQHHERENGSVYPQGLVAYQILLESKILAVADVMEAMSSHRPYRPAFGEEQA